MFGPKIAVVGAGPAGLTFARLLQRQGFDCTVYEAEADRHARIQGGSLDLRANSGQRALREAGLFEEFRRRSRPEGQALKLVKSDGRVVFDDQDLASDRPEIDREELRGLLIDSVDQERLMWNHKVDHIGHCENGQYEINFRDGTRAGGFDLVVGADGAWSKVRRLVTEVNPHYAGVTQVELWTRNISTTSPWLSDYVGAGTCFMFDEGRCILCQRNGGDAVRVYVALQQPESWREDCKLNWSNSRIVRQKLVNRYFSDCADDVRRCILEANGDCVARPLYMMPVGHRWESRSGVTLLGDAAHVFTPYAGEGVNLALTDAIELANKILARKEDLFANQTDKRKQVDSAIREYESEMFERATSLAKRTEAGLKGHFSKDGIEKFASLVTGRPISEFQAQL